MIKDTNIKNKTIIIYRIINYLNSITSSEYKPILFADNEDLHKLIDAGYEFKDFKQVIEKKWNDWKGTKYEMYVRPSTLFGEKFENYLNEKSTNKNKLEQLHNVVERVKSTNWRLDKK